MTLVFEFPKKLSVREHVKSNQYHTRCDSLEVVLSSIEPFEAMGWYADYFCPLCGLNVTTKPYELANPPEVLGIDT